MKRTGVRFRWLKFEQTDRQEQTMNFFNRSKSSTATIEPTFDAPTSAVEDITGDYTIDQTHTRLGFSARHAMVTTVRGQFTDFTGTAHIDTANPAASKVALTIQTASIDTGVADRDGHLKSADFFDADNNKEITFVSTKVEREDASTWLITGDLRVGFEGATSINRKDWDLSWNAALETGGVLVSEKIKLEFDVSAIQNG